MAAWFAGIVYVVLIAFFVYAATYDRATTGRGQPLDGTTVLVFTGLVVVPAVALWWTHNRYWYGFAGGLIAPWAALMLFLQSVDDGGWPTAEELDRKADRIAASGTPAYYLGENPRGNDLEDIVRDGEFGAHGVRVGYDFHCQGDLGCDADISVDTLSMSPWCLREWRCERLDPVPGVPAVRLGNGDLTLFTGHSMISLADNESDDALEGELNLAPMLRAFGATDPVAALPAPEPAVLRSVEKLCTATP